MRQRLADAAQEGVILGVKYGIALILSLFSLSWALGDYGVVRERALNGQKAFEYLQQVAQQQQATPKPTAPVNKE